ncbi:MAG TPA: hypothetical protein DE060_08785 [Lentisphaeria bacterium]|nr:hypothetical protein [Lentisphaeria bacterium]HCG49282.1 hypothetical protein [Lentisphaeria bacterium]
MKTIRKYITVASPHFQFSVPIFRLYFRRRYFYHCFGGLAEIHSEALAFSVKRHRLSTEKNSGIR